MSNIYNILLAAARAMGEYHVTDRRRREILYLIAQELVGDEKRVMVESVLEEVGQ